MFRVLLFLSFFGLLLVSFGTAFAPNDPAFWLASGEPVYQQVRAVLMGILFVQLVTNPPRHKAFRVLAGIVSALVGIWVVQATYNYHMQFTDTLGFASAAIAIAVAALERPVQYVVPKLRATHLSLR